MSASHHSARFMARAAVLLPLAIAAASCSSGRSSPVAYLDQVYRPGQNTDFGAQQESVARRAASTLPTGGPLTAEQRQSLDRSYAVGQNTAFGADRAQQPVEALRGDVQSRFASTVPMVGGKPDLVGGGGPQDDVARQIYGTGHDIREMLGGP
jgi:hypothetical protein